MYEFRCSVTRVFLRLKQNEADKVATSATVENAFMANQSFIELEDHLLPCFLTFESIQPIVNTYMFEFRCSVTRVFLHLKQNEAEKVVVSATVESAFKANRLFIEPENHRIPCFLTFLTI